jgi:hypothetical protein
LCLIADVWHRGADFRFVPEADAKARSFKNCCLAGARQKDLRVQPLACGSFAKRAVVERAAATYCQTRLGSIFLS